MVRRGEVRHSGGGQEKVLSELYPFVDVPAMDATLLDLHTDTFFRVGDYLAIREGDLNFLAAPKYAEAGGTVLDWIDPDSTENSFVLKRELLALIPARSARSISATM